MSELESKTITFSLNGNEQQVVGQEFHTDDNDVTYVRIGFKDPDPDSTQTQYFEFKISDLLSILAKSTGIAEQVKETYDNFEKAGKLFTGKVDAAIKAFNKTP